MRITARFLASFVLSFMLISLAYSSLEAFGQITSLSYDVPITGNVDFTNNTFTYTFSAVAGYYSVLALKPPIGADMDLYLYDDASMTNQVLKSSSAGHSVEVVVVDRNELPQRNYYAKARQIEWDGTFKVELDGGKVLHEGANSGSFGNNEIIDAWDITLHAGEKCFINLTSLPIGSITSIYAFHGNSYMYNRTEYTSGFIARGEKELTFYPNENSDYCIVLVNENAIVGPYVIDVEISAGDFAIEPYPGTLTNVVTYQGGKAIFPMRIVSLGLINVEVTLSLYNPPPGCTYSFTQQIVTTTNFSALELIAETTPFGNYNIRIDGVCGGSLRSVNFTLSVVDSSGLPYAAITSLSPNPCISGSPVAYSGQGLGHGLGDSIVACKWRSSIYGEFSQSFSGTTTVLTEGLHVIYFKVQDGLGNWSIESQEWLLVLPKEERPIITINSPLDGNVLTGTCDISWNVTGVLGGTIKVSIFYSSSSGEYWNLIEDSLIANGTYSWKTYEHPNGSYLLKLRAYEKENFTGGKEVYSEKIAGPFNVMNIGVQNKVPTTILVYPEDNGIISSSIPLLVWRAVDDDGDSLFYDVYLDKKDASTLVSRMQKSNYFYPGVLELGISYYWRVVPYDGKNYGECISGKFTFKVGSGSNEPPLLIRMPDTDISVKESEKTNLSVKARDDEGSTISMAWFLDGRSVESSAITNYQEDGYLVSTFTYNPNYNSAGRHVATLLSVDSSNPRAASIAEFDITVINKNRKPNAVIDLPREGAKFDSNELVTFSANSSFDADGDSLIFIWYVDDSEIEYEKFFSAQLPPGNHTITLQVSDRQYENSTAYAYVNITITRTIKPSLELYGISFSPASAKEGEIVSISACVKNKGMITTPIIALVLLIDGEEIATQSISPIIPGDEGYAKFEWTARAGTHSITVRISSPLSSEAEISRAEYTEWIEVSPVSGLGYDWLIILLLGLVIAIIGIVLVYRTRAKKRDMPIGARESMRRKDKEYSYSQSYTQQERRPQLPPLSSSLKKEKEKTYISKMPKDYKKPSEKEIEKIKDELKKDEISTKKYTSVQPLNEKTTFEKKIDEKKGKGDMKKEDAKTKEKG
ncbi:MAG: CARDB domain-containing protein, partial [Thermoplasmata archaeon]